MTSLFNVVMPHPDAASPIPFRSVKLINVIPRRGVGSPIAVRSVNPASG
ncbi:MAG: hypothetical protein GVY08_02355 [Bacteroidetes bacterium]|nr:hypothetical protein [Bacteroidota bacterium]